MLAAAGQAILHATVAALVVEALVRLWRVEDPGERLAMRAAAIAAPIVFTTAYLLAAPWRAEPWFADRWALFAGASWNHVRIGGVGAATAAALVLSAAGLALYLRDTIPFVADRVLGTPPGGALGHDHPAAVRVERVLATHAPSMAPRPSAVTVIECEAPVLLCTGIGRTAIVVSTGTLARMDDDTLGAALAHETAHLAARDPLLGWGLMAARTLQCFNPVVQVLARLAVQDIERRADVAVAALGRGAPLALAIQRVTAAGDAHSDLGLPTESGPLGDRLLASAHRRAIDARCELLIDGAPPAAQPYPGSRIALTVAAVAGLLFLVV